MRTASAWGVVFSGGAAIMVLEIVGARYLARDFGGSFYVWVSQIGVIMAALAVGYYVGGWLADRYQRPFPLALLMVLAGAFTCLIPDFSPRLLGWIVERHPADAPIPLIWRKLDPMMGSTVVFFLPCLVLASLSPFMIRLAALRVEGVGRLSGLMFSVSTAGSIVGVFGSGYILLDPAVMQYLGLSGILRLTGIWMMMMAGYICWMDRSSEKATCKTTDTSAAPRG